MNGFKQRVVGALVLVSLAVIFLPMMFDEPRGTGAIQPMEIPKEPEVPVIEIARPEIPVSDVQQAALAASAANAVDLPGTVGEAGVAETWTVKEESGQQQAPGGLVSNLQDSQPAQPGSVAPTSRAPMITPVPAAPPLRVEPPAVVVRPPQPAAPVPVPAPAPVSKPVPPRPAPEPVRPPVAVVQPKPESVTPPAAQTAKSAGWMIQLGSFGSRANAENLRSKVSAYGYPSSTVEVNQGGKVMIRVYSGPFTQRAEADKVKSTLSRAFGVNGIVVSSGS